MHEGRTALSGDIPINPSGGLKSFGHPIGASGVRMIYECVTQLRGQCGERQVEDAELGLAHNVGGPGAVACVIVLGTLSRATCQCHYLADQAIASRDLRLHPDGPAPAGHADRAARLTDPAGWRRACMLALGLAVRVPQRRHGIGSAAIDGTGSASAATESSGGVDRKRIVILLRSVVIATCAYLAVRRRARSALGAARSTSRCSPPPTSALAFAPRRLFYMPHFGPCLLLADTAVILFGMSWSHGLSQDLLLAYFFTVFLITIGETLGQIAIGSALIAAVLRLLAVGERQRQR